MPRSLPGEHLTPDQRAEKVAALGDRVCWDGCQRDNVVWMVDNELWLAVMGRDRARFVLCPVCFVREAEALDVGVCAVWRLTPGPESCNDPPQLEAAEHLDAAPVRV